MKVVIPVAGLGTRMLPATKVIPKEMLNIFDRPMIQYIVDECAAAGIKEVVLVTHSSKTAIENHFDTQFELETTLEKRVKRQLLEEVRSITPPGVTIIHVRQGQALGLGHAIACARPIVGNEPFAVVLPDVLLAHFTANQKAVNLAEMIKRFEKTGKSQILVAPVAKEDVVNYGIVQITDNEEFAQTGCSKIQRIVEKPSVEEAPSNLSVVGRYVFDKAIWPLIEKTPLGVGGEIQLSDAIDMLIADKEVDAYLMQGESFDCGSKIGYFDAFVEYAINNPKHGKEVVDALKRIAKKYNFE
ncbi:UTP--glucose-1-phosphate uridylyltransferase GalU [Psittacicella hinzii]|uniref:UTP--glucose-1-phosphate uridylyltransferase n=1 Tax=Psittacicella hinzii TaxID=2028575 RepID=A0A3A1YSM7_9GAMM|nr:UTP--glucose-1-phosphate uridylyltransferase GalU [Psittacicella hinzii]RIY39037.1 UTP--glucose-1-phosphate uridylyltransferase [Psittacicella hinzii]